MDDIFDFIGRTRTAEKRRKIENLTDALRTERYIIRERKTDITTHRREIKKYLAEKRMLKSKTDSVADSMRSQIEEIRKLDYIEKVLVRRAGLTVYYRAVTLNGNDIGRYKLIITVGEREELQIRRVDGAERIEKVKVPVLMYRTVSVELEGKECRRPEHSPFRLCQHPHINTGGQMCFGGLDGRVTQSLNMGNLLTPVEQVYNLLNSYDEEGPYVNIRTFLNHLRSVRKLGYSNGDTDGE